MTLYESRLTAIENYLATTEYPKEPTNLYDPIRYFMTLGGKRIRPLFTVLSAELFGESLEKSLPAAAALEMFHNFTLIHDDIMDGAPKRRNLPTVHEKWNSNIAILSGDALMIHAFQELSHYEANTFKALSSLLHKTSIEVCIGQQMDMDFETMEVVSEAQYLEMIRLKTSVLLGCACAFGGIIGNASETDLHHLYQFGEQLGIAFQIQDDLLDAFGSENKVGKQIGGDILSDKKTLLFTAFQSQASMHEKEQFRKLSQAAPNEKIKGIKQLYMDTKVLEYCKAVQETHWKNCQEHLKEVHSVAGKELLEELLTFIIHRNY
ncbi:MAG: polyprenyl synthetase family protein [Bacteroidota bacterium]